MTTRLTHCGVPIWMALVWLFWAGTLSGCDSETERFPCRKDIDCRLDRICDSELGACVFPLTRSPTDPSTGSGGAMLSSVGTGGSGIVGGSGFGGGGGTQSSSGGGVGQGGAATGGAATGGAATGGEGGMGAECTLPSECPGADMDCRYRTCIAQQCGMANAPALTDCNGASGDQCDGLGNCLSSGAWSPLAVGPSARYLHTAVWTGTEMIVWGGRDDNGELGDGSRYDPAANTWTPVTNNNAPSARFYHEAVWTGTEMIVWGGFGQGDYLATGGRYNPSTNTWSTMSNTNAPSGRTQFSMVWTGSRAIVWGGIEVATAQGDGKLYDPATNSWADVPSLGSPSPRFAHSAIYAAGRMIIWGGADTFDWFGNGAMYLPSTDSWTTISNANAPSFRQSASVVWNGGRAIFWAGWNGGPFLDDGAYLDPDAGAAGTWSTLAGGAPAARRDHVALWTEGSAAGMFVWGGCGGMVCGTLFGDGAFMSNGAWTYVPVSGTLPARRQHRAVWTGSQVVVWGGLGSNGAQFSGARMTP